MIKETVHLLKPHVCEILLGAYFVNLVFLPSKTDLLKGVLILSAIWFAKATKTGLLFFIDAVSIAIVLFFGASLLANFIYDGNMSKPFVIITWLAPYAYAKVIYARRNLPPSYFVNLFILLMSGILIANIFLAAIGIKEILGIQISFTNIKFTFVNISRTALYTAIAAVFAADSFFSTPSKSWKSFYGTAFFILMIGLTLIHERTAYLAFIISFFLVLIRHRKLGFFMVTIAFIVLSIFLFNRGTSHFDQKSKYYLSWDKVKKERSFLVRKCSWSVGLNMFLDSPVIGMGFKNFKKQAAPYVTEYRRFHPQEKYRENHDDAHNININLLAESGITGFLLMNFILVYPIFLAVKSRLRSPAAYTLGLAMILFCINAQMHMNLYSSNISGLIFLIIGIIMGLRLAPAYAALPDKQIKRS